MCLLSRGGAQSWGGSWQGKEGGQLEKEKKGEGTGWGTVKGALLQSYSCFTTWSSCVDHRRCMGWMTNKFRKLSQVGAAHNEVSVNLQPQTIMGLMSTAVDPSLVETSPGVYLGFSWWYTQGDILAENSVSELCFLGLSVPGQANKFEEMIQKKIPQWTQLYNHCLEL